MNLEKLNPWNWFKHEENSLKDQKQIPISRTDAESNNLAGLMTNSFSPDSSVDSFLRLHRDMERLFDAAWNSFGVPNERISLPLQAQGEKPQFSRSALGNYSPNLDVSGDKEKYDIALDVPGLAESDISIEVSGDILRIKGKKEEKNESKDKQFYRIERHYGSFERTLSLPKDVNTDNISATLKDGILKLAIPRVKTLDPDIKKIAISS